MRNGPDAGAGTASAASATAGSPNATAVLMGGFQPPTAKARRGSPWPLLPLLCATPALVFLVWALLIPMISLVIRSITSFEDGGLTFANYFDVFANDHYRTSFFNSILVAVLSTVIAIVLAVPTALELASASGRFKTVADAVLTFPLSLPGVAVGFFVIVLFGRAGVVPAGFRNATGEPQMVIAYQMSGLMLAYLYFQLPRVLGTMRGAAENLDPALVEVSRTLGASPWRTLFRVTLPALAPAIVAAAGIATASSLGAYGTVAALSEGFRVLPLDVAEQATLFRNGDLSSAMALVLAFSSLGFGIIGSRLAKVFSR